MHTQRVPLAFALAFACRPASEPSPPQRATAPVSDTGVTADPAPPTPLRDADRLCTGGMHNCFIDDDRSVQCWGLAPGLDGYRANQIEGIDNAVEVSCGYATACARTEEGRVACWDHAKAAFLPDVEDAADFSIGGDVACVATTDGSARCWRGMLESFDFEFTDANVDAVEVAAGFYHGCYRTRAGEVRCWGKNGSGQLGTAADDPTYTEGWSSGPQWAAMLVFDSGDSAAVDVHEGSEVEIEKAVAACLADTADAPVDLRLPIVLEVEPPNQIAKVVAGRPREPLSAEDEARILDIARALAECMQSGAARWTRLPSRASKRVSVPLEIVARPLADIDNVTYHVMDDAIAVSARGYGACAVRSSGETVCWGQLQDYGVAAYGVPVPRGPVPIPGLDEATSIGVGWTDWCVRRKDGTTACLGETIQGVFGVSGDAPARSGAHIEALDGFRAVAMGPTLGCGIDAELRVMCFGNNDRGRMGIGHAEGGLHGLTAVLGLEPAQTPK